MLIFPIFSALVWAMAMLWRRQWPSFAAVTGAVVFLLLLLKLFAAWHEHLPPMSSLFYELMWPYILLTGSVGYYICFLPRRDLGELDCVACGYHLRGLDPVGLRCPECGATWRGKGSGHEEEPVELTPIINIRRPRVRRPKREEGDVIVIPWPDATAPRSAES